MDTKDVSVLLFIGFLGIVSSVIVEGKNVFPYSSIIILVATGLACIGFAVIFDHYSKPKQPYRMTPFNKIPTKPTKRERITYAIIIAGLSFDLAFAFIMPIVTWQIVYVNGVASLYYITIWDLFLVLIFIAGIWLVYVTVRAFRESKDT